MDTQPVVDDFSSHFPNTSPCIFKYMAHFVCSQKAVFGKFNISFFKFTRTPTGEGRVFVGCRRADAALVDFTVQYRAAPRV
jgi:hypothetical protein